MHILWIHQNLVTGHQAGNSRAVRTAAALLEAGATLDIIASNRSYFGDPVPAGRECDGRLTLHRLPVDDRAERGSSYIDFNRRAFACARKLAKPDIIFCSSPPLPQAATSLLLARGWNVPLALEVRDLWPAFVIEGGLLREGVVAWVMRLLENLAYRSAGSLISVSPGFLPYLQRMGCTGVVTAPTGGDPELLHSETAVGQAWRERHGIAGPMILYAGSFNAAYGIPQLLEAARRPPYTWVFAGNGADRHRVESGGVLYLGSLSRAELLPALLAADVGINTHADWPLLDTTITGKLFDYMAAGVPVVSLRDGQMGAIIRAAGCGVVTHDLYAGIETVLHQPELGPAGREWVAGHMQADAMARRVAAAVLQAGQQPLLRHLPGAVLATVTGRGPRALADAYGANRQQAIEAAFAGWPAHASPDALPIPALLG
jgi:glycosyltransferase involved in cell wall biosynthesis